MSKLEQVRLKKSTFIGFDGNQYTLVFDFNAFAELEEEFGGIPQVLELMSTGKATVLRKILWAGLQHDHEGVTLRDAGKLMGVGDMPHLAKLIHEGISTSLPEAKNSETRPAKEMKK